MSFFDFFFRELDESIFSFNAFVNEYNNRICSRAEI